MLTTLQRAAIDYSYPGPNSLVSPDGTVTFQLPDQPRETEDETEYLAQLMLLAEASVAKIAGFDRAQHLASLRERQVTQEMVDYIADHWDSFDLDDARDVFALASKYAQEAESSTDIAGPS